MQCIWWTTPRQTSQQQGYQAAILAGVAMGSILGFTAARSREMLIKIYGPELEFAMHLLLQAFQDMPQTAALSGGIAKEATLVLSRAVIYIGPSLACRHPCISPPHPCKLNLQIRLVARAYVRVSAPEISIFEDDERCDVHQENVQKAHFTPSQQLLAALELREKAVAVCMRSIDASKLTLQEATV